MFHNLLKVGQLTILFNKNIKSKVSLARLCSHGHYSLVTWVQMFSKSSLPFYANKGTYKTITCNNNNNLQRSIFATHSPHPAQILVQHEKVVSKVNFHFTLCVTKPLLIRGGSHFIPCDCPSKCSRHHYPPPSNFKNYK